MASQVLSKTTNKSLATVDLERDYRGQPELRQVAFSLELRNPKREGAPKKRTTPSDAYQYWAQARVGDVRLKPLRPIPLAIFKCRHSR